jgi:hypothetical protein
MPRTEERNEDLCLLCSRINKIFERKGLNYDEGMEILLTSVCAQSIINGMPRNLVIQMLYEYWDDTKEMIKEGEIHG